MCKSFQGVRAKQEVTTELTEQKFAPCAEFPLIAKAQGENAQKIREMMEDKRGQEVTTELTEQKFAPCAEFPLIAKAQGENAQEVCLEGDGKTELAMSCPHLGSE